MCIEIHIYFYFSHCIRPAGDILCQVGCFVVGQHGESLSLDARQEKKEKEKYITTNTRQGFSSSLAVVVR